MRKLLIVIVLFLICMSFYSEEFKFLENIILEEKGDDFIREPTSFFVTEENFLYIFDAKAANIKIFNSNGKYVKSFGRYGLGPNEFLRPAYGASYNNLILINDLKKDHLFIFKRTKINKIKFYKKFYFSGINVDIKFLNSNELLLSGLNSDSSKKGNPAYGLIKFNLKNDKVLFILPLTVCFGYKTEKELDEEFIQKLRYLNPFGFIDFTNDYFFYIYSGSYKIIRFNRENNKTFTFGNKFEGYIKPYVTKKLIKASARYGGNRKMRSQILNKMSFVLNLFIGSEKRVFICVSKYNHKKNNSELYLVSYDINGKFMKEVKMKEIKDISNSNIIFYFSKKKHILYIIKTEIDNDFNHQYRLLKYNIKS